MKNIFYLLLFPIISVAQQKSDTTDEKKKVLPYYIEWCTDKMTDKSYAFGSKSLVCSEDGKKGFIVRISWNWKNDQLYYRGVTVKSVGIGSCVENSTLILLFDDDSKYQLSAWNDFNCEGDSYMDWDGKSMNRILGKKVKAIRFQNGRTFDSYTYNLSENQQNYFVEVASAVSEKRIVFGSCD
jgi:hypothetical protein